MKYGVALPADVEASRDSTVRKKPARLADDQLGFAGFDEDMIRAGLEGAIRVAAIAVAGNREHRNVSSADVGAQALAQLNPVDAGHRDVRQDEIRSHRECLFEGLMAVVGLCDSKPAPHQRFSVETTCVEVVFDDENEQDTALSHL